MTKSLIKAFVLSVLATLSFASSAHSQTQLDSNSNLAPPPPPSSSSYASGVPGPALVSKDVVAQAKAQVDGNFEYMARSSVGGQIQSVWNDTIQSEGVFEYQRCEACVYKIRVREFMVTSVILPKGIRIHSFDVGDGAQFHVKKRADNILAIQPVSGGMDTSMQVYTKSGGVFPFYLRAEKFNSKNVPDLVVQIKDTSLKDHSVIKTAQKNISQGDVSDDDTTDLKSSDTSMFDLDALKGTYTPPQNTTGGATTASGNAADFVQTADFDPDKLHGWSDYELWGDDRLRPETVFRDDHFTYIQFGDNWKDVELPTAYVVIDGIDELVNTRIQGSTFIIESTQALVTLKSGQAFLCLKYEGEA